ncbi:PREDICTED: coiled-coil domain-containing protein 137 [Nanorana parkeri]|uniref:coiled-coil domain-containing protein 137 n=1 Tax=Nanorana parkeri TaxID=125878 RepID=UPI000854695D|nr:PREDICTED: coiled-coil domain-containing protein 137 [Nanorana parkeri]
MAKRPTNKLAGPAGRAVEGPGRPRGKVKKKMNSKPKDLDTQEIPFKLREIMKSRIQMNKPKGKKKRKPVPRQGPRNEELQTDIPVPKFKRERNESVGGYFNRMNRETQHVIFLTKNQVDRCPEMELDDKGKLPEKEEEEEEELKVTKKQKSEKRKEYDRKCLDKFVKKREDKKVARLEEEFFKDTVMFGEVAMEPPSLTVKPRKGAAQTKPGEKQLFLKKFFDQGSKPASAPPVSMARKRIIEEERERVIKAYRELNKKKHQQAADSKPPRTRHT